MFQLFSKLLQGQGSMAPRHTWTLGCCGLGGMSSRLQEPLVCPFEEKPPSQHVLLATP